MQRFAARRVLSETNSLRLPQRCFFSQLAQKEESSLNEHETFLPRMPPFDYSPPPYDGPSADEILAKRKTFLSPSLFHLYSKPLNVVDGKMQYLFDENGRRYLDAFGGIATVCCGHCHPYVVDSIVNQIKRIQHSTVLYLNHAIADFAEALASKMPGNLKVVFFTNSGTEANELAIMMARLYTGCNDIISLRNAYHGNAAGTMGATAQSNWKFNVVQTGVHHALNPDPYRGVFGADGEMYAKDVQDLIDFGTSGHVAGFLSESIQGVGGIIELAPGYLPAVYKSIKKAGGLCIADEVQAGFARTGSHFWGFEAHGVVPDIVTMAKGIGNGIPLGAVVTTPEIAEVLTRRNYFNTFGGNPVCTAAGHAVLKVIQKDKLQNNAHVVGSYLKEKLTALKDKYGIIGDVRGRGFLLGVEFVTDRQLKTPAKTETLYIMDKMKEMGVLVGKGGFYGNVFRITPPLCFTKEDAGRSFIPILLRVSFTVQCEYITCLFGFRLPCRCYGLLTVEDVKPPTCG
ncbi:putative aminotransferase class III superfamily protein [Citrus sinensis]|nr:putative aminotransferase class III superfamily protein [Citrus sinensis]